MNSHQAKQLSLPGIMARLGYQPTDVKKNGGEVWYRSPFRQEKEASFHTSYLGGKWIWNDFGDIGGTVIDFILRHENFTRVKDALAFLDQLTQGHLFETTRSSRAGELSSQSSFSFQSHDRNKVSSVPQKAELALVKVEPISNPIILRYLEQERCIPQPLAHRYLQEITYRNTKKGRDYFAFGMANQSGGYEIRAASSQFNFKSALNGRDVTWVKGQHPNVDTVLLFEGMIDFLSYLVMKGGETPLQDAIIMHSLSSFKQTESLIQQRGYQYIHTYLDNNRPGQQATQRFQQLFPSKTTSYSQNFAPHIDLNDALCAKKSA